jgi:hypothetical protein
MFRNLLCAALAAWGLTACVSVQLPSIAHVHVGHAVTAWPDTPDKKGLFDIAQQEAKIVAEHAGYAVAGARDIKEVKLHLGHVLHALNPALEKTGPGMGYGLMKSLDGASDHLGFAAEVKDVSAHLKSGLPTVIAALKPLRQETQVLAILSRDARQASDLAQVVAYAEEVRQRSEKLVAQLGAVRKQLDGLLAAESPAYQPIAQRYLFGIIRLPSGEWAYNPDVQGSRRGSYY